MDNNLNTRAVTAFKWSSFTELLCKVITPLIYMLLARILAPEAFGVLATIIMIVSFAEVFVESGFQKFLIQHQFETEDEERKYMSVAFWSNLFFSIFLWILLIVFCKPITRLVGNEGYELPVILAGVTIPLYGIIGIQNCKLKKTLEFKKLFVVRFSTALVPLIITLPLALLGLDYWSLVIGNIAGVLTQSIILLIIGGFKPIMYFDSNKLVYMLSFGIWTLLDGIAVWLTSWLDAFLIGRSLSNYYLGLYRNSSSTVLSLFNIVFAAITPVLFASLSNLQKDTRQFNHFFLKVQKTVAMLLLPISLSVFFKSDLVTFILFGDKWLEASQVVSIMSLCYSLRLLFVSLYGDVYRAKGLFFLPFFLQLLDLCILIPVCLYCINRGFWSLVYGRSFAFLFLIIPEMLVLWRVCSISPIDIIKNMSRVLISITTMLLLYLISGFYTGGYFYDIIVILVASIAYLLTLFAFKEERNQYLKPFFKTICQFVKR